MIELNETKEISEVRKQKIMPQKCHLKFFLVMPITIKLLKNKVRTIKIVRDLFEYN